MEKQELQIMPPLPRFFEEHIRKEDGFTFSFEEKDDLFLLFLSLCYNNQKNNSFEVYNFLFSFLEKNFSKNSPFLYAKFHYALLHPPKQTEEVLNHIIRLFPAENLQNIVAELTAGGLFNSAENRQIFAALNHPENEQMPKKHFSNLFALSPKHLQNFSEQIKKTLPNPFKTPQSQELQHPLSAFQHNVYEYFSQFYPLLSGKKQLLQELEQFFSTLQNQDYHIAVAGEGKRGKSSLINALLQNELSFVEEAVPKTAVPVEFYYAQTESFHAEFLEEKDAAMQKSCSLQQGLFHKQTDLSPFSYGKRIKIHKHQLADYMDVEGKFVQQTAKIYIGTDNRLLKEGFHLSDTPGLNCVNAFHDYLTFKECLKADCLIFIVDARKPDSATELNFLREVAAKGRMLSLIGVITNTDRLNSQESAVLSKERAATLFQEIQRQNPDLEFLGPLELNPKMLMEHFCFHKNISKEQHETWNTFLKYIQKAVQHNNRTQEYQKKIRSNAQALLRSVETLAQKEHKDIGKTYPRSFVTVLETHRHALIHALEKYRTQAEQLTQSAEKEIANWQKQQENALNKFEKEFVQVLQLKAHEFADTLGTDIAKNDKWKEFDQKTAKETAQTLVREFIKTQEEQLILWEEKIKLFHKNMHMLSNECLETVSLSVNSMGSTVLESTTLNNILIHGNIKMKQLSLFLAGAGSGFMLSASFFNLVTVGSIALAFLGDPVSISGLVLTGLGALTLHVKGDIQKHKKNILQKKQKKIESWAKTIRTALADAMNEKQKELSEQYRQVVKQSFLPSFELLFSETVHIYWYTEFIKELQKNTDAEFQHTMHLLQNAQLFLEDKK